VQYCADDQNAQSLKKRRPVCEQIPRYGDIFQRYIPGYADHRSIKQILSGHKTDGYLVQQGLHYEETKPKEQYHSENFIEDVYNLFSDAVSAKAARNTSAVIHNSTPSLK
jgi:hypothetical protein